MFVDRFRFPFPSNVFVNTGVHWFNGRVTLGLDNR
jgi:hypothetical protein